MQGLQAQALPIIRKSNPTRWVLVAATNYGTVQGLAGYTPPRDPHTAVSLSFYYPMSFTHQNIPFSSTPIKYGRAWGNAEDVTGVASRANEAMDWARANQTRLFAVEFGVYEHNPPRQRAGWLRAARKAFERRGVGRLGLCRGVFDIRQVERDVETSREGRLVQVSGPRAASS